MTARIGPATIAGGVGPARDAGRDTREPDGRRPAEEGSERTASNEHGDRVLISPAALRGPLGSGGRGGDPEPGLASADAEDALALEVAPMLRLAASVGAAVLASPAAALRSHEFLSADRLGALLRG